MFVERIENLTRVIGRTIAWLLIPMVAVTFLVVVLRYVFSYGRVDLQELIIYLHAFVLMLGMSYTMYSDQHVRVDIFYQKFDARRRAQVDLFGHLVFLIPMTVVILTFSWEYAAISWKIKEHSFEQGGLPFLYILKSLTPAMAILLLLQAIADSVRQVGILLHKQAT